jgi:4-amino-4-deoxy-L-arabinose transferase-like glycosyltransferase
MVPGAIAALAAVLYGWGMRHGALQPYYSAAVRSMASSWHAFIFGGIDPSGSISLDKIPGSFWLQALSLRLFGVHVWAVELPQVLEGVGTVLVLHRLVRDWIGFTAATVAALAFTLTPIVVVLNRDDLPDTLLILLLVLAAEAGLKAARTGNFKTLLLCGLWVALAFQAKMVQAWLVLPALVLPYLVSAPHDAAKRWKHVGAMTLMSVALSLSWVFLVWLTPAADRPYVDATVDNNPFQMVLTYNGFGRFGSASGGESAIIAAGAPADGLGWRTLLAHAYAPQITWLLPFAVIALAVGIAQRRGLPRTSPVRAGYLLWGAWLVIHLGLFSVTSTFHGYYTGVLAPSIAALTGAGVVHLWITYANSRRAWWILPAAVAVSTAWAVYLGLRYRGFLPWLPPLVIVFGLGAAFALVVGRRTLSARTQGGIDNATIADERAGPGVRAGISMLVALAVACFALLLSPAAWGISALDPVYASTGGIPLAGPVSALYHSVVVKHQPLPRPYTFGLLTGRSGKLLTYLEEHHGTEEYLVATQSAEPAEPLLRRRVGPVLVMGGFTGLTPFPTGRQFASLVADGEVRFALLTENKHANAAAVWIRSNCAHVDPRFYREQTDNMLKLYDCRPTTS